ncbi:hypothetical protein CTZ27_21690 [Streptomyces griseocarneus]|nr:hypothetical protein CTZ27_21690 [Streptomyces griseocarneus]
MLIGVVAGAAVLGVGAAFAVPAARSWAETRHDETSRYTTGAEAKADRKSMPRWLPDDARDVHYAMKTTGGDRILKATLPDGTLPASCTPLPAGTTAKQPAIAASWFPGKDSAKATARCGLYYANTDGTTLHAWQDDEDWKAAGLPEG